MVLLIKNRGLRVVGLDEAGRGSIIGPLVIGGVVIEQDNLDKLSEIGVKDSKKLSPVNRNRLLPIIHEICENVVTSNLSPSEIDDCVINGKKYRRLNYLEAITMGKVALELDPDIIYVDASDTNPERFAKDIKSILNKDIEIISVHHADELFPVVSAASIVAKCKRDADVELISKNNGVFGSGYPSDSKTIHFLKKWFKTYGEKPDFSRKSWKTWDKIKALSLDDF